MTFTSGKGHTNMSFLPKSSAERRGSAHDTRESGAAQEQGDSVLPRGLLSSDHPFRTSTYRPGSGIARPAPHKSSRAALKTATHCGLWSKTGSF